MKTITTTVYTFDELSDKAKERAREWWRAGGLDYEWWDGTYEDAACVGLEITGFDLGRAQTCEGKLTVHPTECADRIIKEHGESCDTFKLAESFLKERDGIVQQAERDEDGELVSEYELDQKLDECEAEFLRALLEEYRTILEKEYEYLLSDESVDENIVANEYTFTADGTREG